MFTLYWTVHHIMLTVECLLFIPFTLYYKWLDKAGKYIYYYVIASIVFAGGGFAMALANMNNRWYFSTMLFIQFCILSCFQAQVQKRLLIRRLVRLLIIPVTVISFLDFFWWEGPNTLNSIAGSTGIALLLIYESIFIVQLLFDRTLVLQTVFVHSLPNFWFNAGLFVLHNTSFLYLLTYNFLMKKLYPDKEAILFYTILGACVFFSGIIQMIFFYIGLRKMMKGKKLNT